VGKSGVLENKNGNISGTRKDGYELTNALSNGAIPDSLRPPLPQDWGFATPTQNSNLKSRESECTEINGLYGRHRIFFFGGGDRERGHSEGPNHFWLVATSLPRLLTQERVKLVSYGLQMSQVHL